MTDNEQPKGEICRIFRFDAAIEPKSHGKIGRANFSIAGSAKAKASKRLVDMPPTTIVVNASFPALQVSADVGLMGLAAMKAKLSTPTSIERPPGYRMSRFLQFFLSKRRFERHFGQVIADNRAEFIEALNAGDVKEASKIKRELNIQLIAMVSLFMLGLPWHLLSRSYERFFGGNE